MKLNNLKPSFCSYFFKFLNFCFWEFILILWLFVMASLLIDINF